MKAPTTIRTRFAPSPTGPLHMGGIRTALYAYLFAKKQGGTFILRIEDTDQNRFVEGAEQYIIDSLQWTGIIPDEGVSVGGPFAPYRQSERSDVYRKYALQLIESGHAYYAFDTPDELEKSRSEAEKKKLTFMYGSLSRMQMKNSLTLSELEWKEKIQTGEPYVIRLKVDEQKPIEFNDLIRGDMSVDPKTVDDKVLLKSDGMPTYHLAHLVDDVLMEITHVIRGEEWLPSAPAHVIIYRYLGWEDKMPAFAHLPLLLKPDGHGKLSKRDGDRLGFPVFPLNWTDPVSNEISSGYREKGYYPQAFINMLALLGWNPGNEQEIFSMDEMIEAFSFEHVHKSGARFDPEKCQWFNAQWLQRESSQSISKRIQPEIIRKYSLSNNDSSASKHYIEQCIDLLKPRVQFEHEIIDAAPYLFTEPTAYDQAIIVKKWKEHHITFFNEWISLLPGMKESSASAYETAFKTLCEASQIKPGEVLQLLRVLVSGVGTGVDLFPMIALFGSDHTSKRIQNALQKIKG